MNRFLILAIFTVALLIPIAIWDQLSGKKQAYKYYQRFDSTHIEGVIDSSGIWITSNVIKLETGSKYVFMPYTDSELNNNNIFSYTVERGDSVFKPAYADTLELIKNGKVLRYTFSKFE